MPTVDTAPFTASPSIEQHERSALALGMQTEGGTWGRTFRSVPSYYRGCAVRPEREPEPPEPEPDPLDLVPRPLTDPPPELDPALGLDLPLE